MGQHGKKFRNASAKVDRSKRYPIDEACKLVPETKVAKFDESVDIAVRLGVDPKHADQMVRGAVVLPHGTGKSQRVVVVAKGEVLVIPSNVPHRAVALEETLDLDVFAPPRQDWLSGTDDYLRQK